MQNQETKICSKCGQEKPLNEFPLRRRGDKIFPHSHCRQCRNEYTRKRRAAYRAAHPIPVRRTETTKLCACCGQEFPIEMMGTVKRYGKVYVGSYCPTCAQAKRKKSDEAYKARMRQRTAERRAANAPKEGHLRCSHCGQEKPIEEFRRETRHSNGRRNMCLECARKYQRERYNRCKKTRKGVFFDNNIGRFIDCRTQYPQPFWNENMLSILRRYYPVSPTQEVCEMVGLSKHCVQKKAKQLGLSKSREYIRKVNTERGIIGGIANKRRIQILKQSQQPSVK